MALNGKKIAVFTGGGLAPALNPTLYGVISAAQKQGMKILGGLKGWACLMPGGVLKDLTDFDPAPLKTTGGTILRSSRTNPFKVDGGVEALKKTLKDNSIDYIVAIGGDDTLGAARRLYEEESIPVVGVPKTIDNDIEGTYWTPGYPSAAHYVAKFCYEVKVDAAYALSRVFVIEVLGRQSGWLAIAGAYGQADVIITPEKENKLDDVLGLIKSRYDANGQFATVVISEEAHFDRDIQGFDQDRPDSFGVARKHLIALGLREKIVGELGLECKALFPGNYVQTGSPIPIDAQTAIQLGERAIDLLDQKAFGRMASLERPSDTSTDIRIVSLPLSEAVGSVRFLPETYYDSTEHKATEAFYDYAEPFLGARVQADTDYLNLLDTFCRP